jgi:hypothetical protein
MESLMRLYDMGFIMKRMIHDGLNRGTYHRRCSSPKLGSVNDHVGVGLFGCCRVF